MGRKPNQLIFEFYTRGPKLDDASNRYEHTCKRCGELFPKGRIDSMMGHLLRRCPNITQVDRETVFLYMQQTPQSRKASGNNTKRRGAESAQSVADGSPRPSPEPSVVQSQPEQVMGLQAEVPYSHYQRQHQTALETLAEVSRRHLDYSSNRDLEPQIESHAIDNGEYGLAEESLFLQLQQASSGASRPAATSDDTEGLYSQVALQPQQEDPSFGVNFAPNVASADVQRTETVVTEQYRAENADQQHVQSDTIDPQLGNVHPQFVSHLNGAPTQPTPEDVMMWNPTSMSGRQSFGALTAPSDQPGPGFGLLGKTTKNKARGRFSDTRRREVQEIRKRGACIRCRMLKKPCSEGTPCDTCAKIESARLWKGTCLRTRLADEFTLWSTNLFHSWAGIEASAAVHGLHGSVSPHRITARLSVNIERHVDFAIKQYSDSPDDQGRVDPVLFNAAEGNDRVIWLLDESEGIADKVGDYFSRLTDSDIVNEISPFMKSTIRQAQIHIQSEHPEQLGAISEQHTSTRSCYNLQDQLVKNVVELWLATSVLSAPDEMHLELQCSSAEEEPSDGNNAGADGERSRMTTRESAPSYSLIKRQLLAAIETRSSSLAKTVINELERRLLQRQQVSRFATFISAVILLDCVERMTALYKTLDSAEATHWPLDTPSSQLWPQGEHFADLLIMLLRMRGLPPRTLRSADGTLVVDRNVGMPVGVVNGKPLKEGSQEMVEAAAAWLNPIGLNVEDLKNCRDGPIVEPGSSSAALGSMKFVSKVLLPESE